MNCLMNRKADILLLFKLKPPEDKWIVLKNPCFPGQFEVKKPNLDQSYDCQSSKPIQYENLKSE